MGGNYQKSKGRSKATFVMLRHDMMDSEAWQALPCPARCVWLEITKRYNSYNNGKIPLSCREVANLCNISKNTASLCFSELIEKGFIRVTEDAAFNVKTKKSRRWRLTHELSHDRKCPTNEWKTWKKEVN